jgi:O-antigen/teichoic acid export membrane protein
MDDAPEVASDIAVKPPVPSFGHGFLSNLLGVGCLAAMQLTFTPLFLRILGVGGYAFIGLFVTLQAILQLLDFGFAPTIARWLARLVAGQEDSETSRDLAKTLEIASWGVAVTIGVALIALAPFGRSWFAGNPLTPATLERTLILMAMALATQFPTAFYQSGLLGLQRPLAMNVAKSVAAIASAGVGALVVVFVSASVPAYFAVQIIVALLNAVALRWLFWRSLAAPGETRGRFRPEVLRASRRFAAGMTGISIFAVLAWQVDRIIVSRMVPLEQFGYYALGWVVASGIALVANPAHNTLVPQLSSMIAWGSDVELRRLYHRGARNMAIVLLPLASVLALFSGPLLQAWTGNATIAARTAALAALLVVGSGLNGLMLPAYALQLASGSTRLLFVISVGQLLFIAPVVVVLTMRYGVFGAACAWPAMNALYLVIGSVAIHRRLLPGAQLEWMVADVALPLAGALVPTVLARSFLSLPSSRIGTIMCTGVILLGAFLGSLLASRAAPFLHGRSPIVESAKE